MDDSRRNDNEIVLCVETSQVHIEKCITVMCEHYYLIVGLHFWVIMFQNPVCTIYIYMHDLPESW